MPLYVDYEGAFLRYKKHHQEPNQETPPTVVGGGINIFIFNCSEFYISERVYMNTNLKA